MFCRGFVCIFVLIQMVLANNNTAPPKVVIYSNGKIVQSSIQINCYVKSYSTPTILWYRKNVLLNCTSQYGCELRTGHYQQHYWSNITKVYLEINDNYTCAAKNANGISKDSYFIPCFEGRCIAWKDNLQERNITINVGQSFSINCELLTQHQYINQCFKFGITHHNRSYSIKHVLRTDWGVVHEGYASEYLVSYMYNITNASKNDSGVYSCYYLYNFVETPESKHCSKPVAKNFNIFVTEQHSKDNDEKRGNITIAIAVSIGSVVAGLILIVSIFCLRKKKLKSQRLYESDPELRWDAFISYSSKDFDWVKELCKTLEQAPFNLTVCLHQRDWEVGRTILDNMAESIYCSHKTLLIVSKSYLESSFCMQELNIAMDYESQKVLKDRVIVVKLDDVSLKNLPKTLRQKSYLDFSNDEQRKHYKTKLLKALPRRELEAQSEESGNEGRSQESGNEGRSEESENKNMEDIPLDDISNDREPLSV